jgi:release factor glutamine methyltransferase
VESGESRPSVNSALRDSIVRLEQARIENASLDAQLLLAKALNCSRIDLVAHPERELTPSELELFQSYIKKRASRYPLAYILGHKEFYGLDIDVSPGVLIPRPETEILVDICINRLKPTIKPIIADNGTGSGAIAVAIAINITEAAVYATEISSEALKVAQRNISKYQLADRVNLLEGDLLEPLKELDIEFDAIVSNPPYIPSPDIETLEPEVAVYEPRGALDGGADGLEAYRRLLPESYGLVKENGFVAVEIGIGEATAIRDIALSSGYKKVETIRDLAGIERVIISTK